MSQKYNSSATLITDKEYMQVFSHCLNKINTAWSITCFIISQFGPWFFEQQVYFNITTKALAGKIERKAQ